MPDTDQRRSSTQEPPDPVHYTSFILRCWISADGQIRARLIDAQSGIGQLVADLADLPEQVRCLMAKSMPSASPEKAQRQP